ncbi:hypothetical protein [Trinickia sp. EG282A]
MEVRSLDEEVSVFAVPAGRDAAGFVALLVGETVDNGVGLPEVL